MHVSEEAVEVMPEDPKPRVEIDFRLLNEPLRADEGQLKISLATVRSYEKTHLSRKVLYLQLQNPVVR